LNASMDSSRCRKLDAGDAIEGIFALTGNQAKK